MKWEKFNHNFEVSLFKTMFWPSSAKQAASLSSILNPSLCSLQLVRVTSQPVSQSGSEVQLMQVWCRNFTVRRETFVFKIMRSKQLLRIHVTFNRLYNKKRTYFKFYFIPKWNFLEISWFLTFLFTCCEASHSQFLNVQTTWQSNLMRKMCKMRNPLSPFISVSLPPSHSGQIIYFGRLEWEWTGAPDANLWKLCVPFL